MTEKQRQDILKAYKSTETTKQIQPNFEDIKINADNINDIVVVANAIVNSVLSTVIDNLEYIKDNSEQSEYIQILGQMNEVLTSLVNDKATLDSLYTDKPTLDGLYASKDGIDSIYSNINELLSIVSDIIPNLQEVLDSSDNATTATTGAELSTEKANEASQSADIAIEKAQIAIDKALETISARDLALEYKNKAQQWANEAEDVVVADSEYSAKHYAIKASNYALEAQSVTQYKDVTNLSIVASGYTTKVEHLDRWLETDTPNVVVDQIGDNYVIDGVLYNKSSTITATLPYVPFDPNANDELLDDSIYGLSTQQIHNTNDIVLTGNELSGNTLDVNVWDTFRATLTIDTNRLKVENTQTYQGVIFLSIPVEIGLNYNISIDVEENDSLGYIQLGNDSNVVEYYNASALSTGTYNIQVTPTEENLIIRLRVNSFTTGESCFYILNYVELDKKTFKAIQDNIPVNTSLANTSYFTPTDILQQDIVSLKESGYTSQRNFEDLSNLYNDEIATTLSYTKVSNGLYNDGTNDLLFAFYHKGRLNSGIYDVTHNPYGTATTDGDTPTSLYECFSIAHSGGDYASGSTAHPSGVYYDIINLDDLVFLDTYAKEVEYDFICREALKNYLANTDELPYKTDQTLLTDYLAYSVQDSSDNIYFPLNEKAGILQISESNSDKTAATLVKDNDNRLLLQIVNDANTTDTVDLTSTTNTVVYLPYYAKA